MVISQGEMPPLAPSPSQKTPAHAKIFAQKHTPPTGNKKLENLLSNPTRRNYQFPVPLHVRLQRYIFHSLLLIETYKDCWNLQKPINQFPSSTGYSSLLVSISIN
jgi:hypothetical protein